MAASGFGSDSPQFRQGGGGGGGGMQGMGSSGMGYNGPPSGARGGVDKFTNFGSKVAQAGRKMGSTLQEISSPQGQQGQFFDTAEFVSIDLLKRLLNEDSDRDKLDGMKRVIAMVSKGQDASPLFPHVVKNVITKNMELKKLVHIFLVHYAELEPDTTLMAINTIQKDLNQPNQYVRASALRVLSSIRLKIILQVVLQAIQKAVKDISPYVRKTAAHAISKVYDLEPELKEDLVPLLEILLADQSTMVLGSAIACWQEMCYDEFDLIHPHFRKIVHVLADIDEWGQIQVLGMLLRYGRTQFADPNLVKDEDAEGGEKAGDANDDNDEEDEDDLEGWDNAVTGAGANGVLDPDHRMLLDNAVTLLRSRNAAVVLGVCSLFYYLAPEPEAQKCAKALTRIMRKDRETQFVVLANVATMATQRPGMFEPVVTEFFVKPYDPAYARTLNLEILTHVVSADSISKVLRELMSYVTRNGDDSEFVTASIRAIGRCASQVPSVADRSLQGLMSLLGSRNPAVVAEALVVIKGLLQRIAHKQERSGSGDGAAAEDDANNGAAAGGADDWNSATRQESEVDMKAAITHVRRLLTTVEHEQARASIVWVIGEYSHTVPLLAPDVFRELAKSFPDEHADVKLQILNLGAKLLLAGDRTAEPREGTPGAVVQKIFKYVLSLAKYDLSYDVRDRGRLMQATLFREDMKILNATAVRLFRTTKPLPTDVSPSDSRLRFTLNSLSHLLSATAAGYEQLPDFPEDPPDPSVRDVLEPEAQYDEGQDFDDEDGFYWDDEDGEEEWDEDDEFYEEGEDGDFYGDDDGEFYDDDGGDAEDFFGDGDGDGGEEYEEDDEEDLDGFFGGAGENGHDDAAQQTGASVDDFDPAGGDAEEDVDGFFD